MSESRDEVATVKKLYLRELQGRSESGISGGKGVSFFRIFKLHFQEGNGNEFKPLYPGSPYGKKQKEFLCTTNMKVAQVSEEVGFANVS